MAKRKKSFIQKYWVIILIAIMVGTLIFDNNKSISTYSIFNVRDDIPCTKLIKNNQEKIDTCKKISLNMYCKINKQNIINNSENFGIDYELTDELQKAEVIQQLGKCNKK